MDQAAENAIRETVEQVIRVHRGKEYVLSITRQVGLQRVMLNGQETLVDAVTILDHGPKLGVTRCYTVHPEKEPTPEELRKREERILRVAQECAIASGLWG